MNRRVKALYIAELVFTLGMATVFLLQSIPHRQHLLGWLALIGASCLYLFASYRFLARIFFSEQLLVDNLHLTITRKTLFSKQINRYNWYQLGPLHYEGKGKKTDHPLKGNSFDYFGFETQEHLIQSLHHEGNLYFERKEGRVYFAPNLYSWDAEKMIQMIKLYSGDALKLGPEWKDMLPEEELDDAAPSGN